MLYNQLKSYEINDLLKLYNEYTKSVYTSLDFYEKILIPVLYKIGDQWENGEIDVATEHECSNAVNTLIEIINQNNTKKFLKVIEILNQ
jgi:MerR family transcriptional regulator, light-induced transcriptional regulator